MGGIAQGEEFADDDTSGECCLLRESTESEDCEQISEGGEDGGCSTVDKNGAVRSRRSAPIEIDVESFTSVCGGSWRGRQGRSVQCQMAQG